VFVFDLILKTAELPFLAPVVKRRHQDDDHHRNEDRDSFDPLRLRLGIVVLDLYNKEQWTKILHVIGHNTNLT